MSDEGNKRWKRVPLTVAMIVALAAYPAAIGPWYYWKCRQNFVILDGDWGPFLPLVDAMEYAPTWVHNAFGVYMNWWGDPGRRYWLSQQGIQDEFP